jgi:hypothetical protein
MDIINKVFTEEEIERIKGNYKPSTLRNTWYLVRSLHKLIKFDKFTDLVDKTNEIDKKIFRNDGFTICVKCNYIFAIKGLLRLCGVEEFDERLEEMCLLLSKERADLQMKKRDKRVIKTDVTIKDIYDYVKSKYTGSSFWMLAILRCCPIRVSEFYGMSKVDRGDNNYIDVKKKRIIIRNHKNKGVREVKLDKTTIDDLKDCVEVCEGLNEKQIKDKFSYILRAYKRDNNIGKSVKLGIQEFRAQAEMDNMSNLKADMGSKDLEKVLSRSKELGHSLESALLYYTAGDSEKKKDKSDNEIVKFMDHKSDSSGRVISLYVKESNGNMLWRDINNIDMFKYGELIAKYKRSL